MTQLACKEWSALLNINECLCLKTVKKKSISSICLSNDKYPNVVQYKDKSSSSVSEEL